MYVSEAFLAIGTGDGCCAYGLLVRSLRISDMAQTDAGFGFRAEMEFESDTESRTYLSRLAERCPSMSVRSGGFTSMASEFPRENASRYVAVWGEL